LGVLGAIGVLYPIVKVLSPSQASLAGAKVEVDVSQIQTFRLGLFLGRVNLSLWSNCRRDFSGMARGQTTKTQSYCKDRMPTPSWRYAPILAVCPYGNHREKESLTILCFTVPVMEGSTRHGAIT